MTKEELNKYIQALEEIKEIARHLYYHSITDPVKREKAIYSIIEIVNNVKAV